jgi:CheY-like chemotaxis protein
VERITAHPATSRAPRRATVLVIEDDRATSDLLRDIVEEAGLRFVPASEGHLAISIALEERPQVITLDLDLPDTDGHAVLHRLLSDRRTKAIPIVVVTGYRKFLPADDYERLAAVVDKPFDVADLARTIQELVDAPACAGMGR